MSPSPFVRLSCTVQSYPYGRKGSASCAARFAAATPENNFIIDENQPYGEMWIGDHPNGSAKSLNGKPLQSLVESDPETYLGKIVYEHFNGDKHLPFLFKVLSIEKALPLQAHPGRSLARQLKDEEKKEKGKNEMYVDTSHKPDHVVAVVISDLFEGFVGFRPLKEIQVFLKSVPELRHALSETQSVNKLLEAQENTKESERLVKQVFSDLLHADQDKIQSASGQLSDRLDRMGLGVQITRVELSESIKKCLRDYPEDIGLFAASFFMNHVKLSKGEGIAIPADMIHVYLQGDVIECMTWSDNMVCPIVSPVHSTKLTQDDVKIFIDMLSYKMSDPKKLKLNNEKWGKSHDGYTRIYHVPLEEFDLLNINLLAKQREAIGPVDGPAVFIVTKGDVLVRNVEGIFEELLRQGQVVFVKPSTTIVWGANDHDAEIWGAFVEV
ncbi:RmlC-like cupin domain-containing protein [Cyathus striatus]|nr:RmlC-like cupin domain-containing protein [Cyathus striatus]